jgi:NAD(P)H-dependent FMN reductase
MVIDQAGPEYIGKPVMEVGVSTGPFMGARVIEHVRPVLVYLGLVSTNAPLYVGNVGDFVTADEVTRDAQYKEKIMKSLHILLAYESRLHGINAELQ